MHRALIFLALLGCGSEAASAPEEAVVERPEDLASEAADAFLTSARSAMGVTPSMRIQLENFTAALEALGDGQVRGESASVYGARIRAEAAERLVGRWNLLQEYAEDGDDSAHDVSLRERRRGDLAYIVETLDDAPLRERWAAWDRERTGGGNPVYVVVEPENEDVCRAFVNEMQTAFEGTLTCTRGGDEGDARIRLVLSDERVEYASPSGTTRVPVLTSRAIVAHLQVPDADTPTTLEAQATLDRPETLFGDQLEGQSAALQATQLAILAGEQLNEELMPSLRVALGR